MKKNGARIWLLCLALLVIIIVVVLAFRACGNNKNTSDDATLPEMGGETLTADDDIDTEEAGAAYQQDVSDENDIEKPDNKKDDGETVVNDDGAIELPELP